MDAFDRLFGLALNKLLGGFITHIPLHSTVWQLTLNTEYSLNKILAWLQARLQSCSHHTERDEAATVAVTTGLVMQRSSGCQSRAQTALVLDCCSHAKKKQEPHSPIQCFNSPPCNTNTAALSRLSQHPLSKGTYLFIITMCQGLYPNTPTSQLLLQLLSAQGQLQKTDTSDPPVC